MRRIFSAFLGFLLSVCSAAEGSERDTVSLEWARSLAPFDSWGRDQAMGSASDAIGNLYVIAKSEGQGTSFDYLTLKYGPDGALQWSARFDGSYHAVDIPNAVAVDDAGNVYVTGMSISSDTSHFDVATIKYTPGGAVAWVAINAGPVGEPNSNDCGSAIAVDGAGNVFVAGFQTEDGQRDLLTIKYNPLGVQLWTAVYDGPAHGTDEAATLVVDESGSVYVSGRGSSVPSTLGRASEFYDYLTIKYDPVGVRQWVASYNLSGTHFATPTASALCEDGSLVITGGSGSLFDGKWGDNEYDYDIVTVKYSSDGELLWDTVFDNHLDYPGGLGMDQEGGIYVTGTTGRHSPYTSAGDSIVTIKYSSAGDLVWVAFQAKGTSTAVQSAGVQVDPSGVVYVTATHGHFAEPTESLPLVGDSIVTLKYSVAGSLQWVQYYSCDGDSAACVRDIALLPSDGVVIIGDKGTRFHSDILAVKYSSYSSRDWTVVTGGSGTFIGCVTAAQVDPAGTTYLTGPAIARGTGVDFVTAKVRPSGEVEWSSRYPLPANTFDVPSAIAIDMTGNVYVAAANYYSDTDTAMVIKYNSSGDAEWVLPVPTMTARALAIDPSGNLLVGGHGIAELHGDGSQLWYADEGFDVVRIQTDRSGGVLATTYVDGYSGYSDSLRKFDINGNPLWRVHSPIDALAVDDSGNAYASGWYGYGSGWTKKLDTNGNEIWSMSYGGPEIAVSGSTVAAGGIEDLHSLTADGTHRWSQGFPSGGWDVFDVNVDRRGGLYSSGPAWNYSFEAFYLQTIRYDASGNQRWRVIHDGTADVGHRRSTIGLDSLDYIYVIGEEGMHDFGLRPLILKYSPYGTVASVEGGQTPTEFALLQNYPNPFNPSTTIRFDLPSQELVELKVFDILGREVATVVNQFMVAGRHEVRFDGTSIASGVYFYRLQAGGNVAVRKLMLMK